MDHPNPNKKCKLVESTEPNECETNCTETAPDPSTESGITTAAAAPELDAESESVESEVHIDNEEEDEDLDFYEEEFFDTPKKSAETSANHEYTKGEYKNEVHKPENILEQLNKRVQEVSETLELPPSTACALLRRFNWTKQDLFDKYYSETENVSIRRLLGLPETQQIPNQELLTCQICDENYDPRRDVIVGECGHNACCSDCWSDYLRMRIERDGKGLDILCPMVGCTHPLSYISVLNFIQTRMNENTTRKYRSQVLGDVVARSQLMTWCPSPRGCGNVIEVMWVDSRCVVCSCGYHFCYGCLKDWHDPLKCEFLETWNKLCNHEALNEEWLTKNTKKCPRCRVPIQKNGGCNIMYCSNPACRTQFCWACLQDGVTHSTPHACSLWPTAGQDANLGKEELANNRLIGCRNKYTTHKNSSKEEVKLGEKVALAIKNFEEEQHRNCAETQFITKSLAKLSECRKTLMYSCGFAYFLDINPATSDNNVMLFDTSFQEFEHAVEGLSWIFENQLDLPFAQFKENLDIKVTNVYKRRTALLSHIYEGYESGWWKFTGNEKAAATGDNGRCTVA